MQTGTKTLMLAVIPFTYDLQIILLYLLPFKWQLKLSLCLQNKCSPIISELLIHFVTELTFGLYWLSSSWPHLIRSRVGILPTDMPCVSYEHGFMSLTMMYGLSGEKRWHSRIQILRPPAAWHINHLSKEILQYILGWQHDGVTNEHIYRGCVKWAGEQVHRMWRAWEMKCLFVWGVFSLESVMW